MAVPAVTQTGRWALSEVRRTLLVLGLSDALLVNGCCCCCCCLMERGGRVGTCGSEPAAQGDDLLSESGGEVLDDWAGHDGG